MRVPADEQRAVGALGRTIFADRLAGRDDVVLVERGVEARTAMPGRAEQDPLRRISDVGVAGKIRTDQRVNVDQVALLGMLTSAFVNSHSLNLR